MRFRAVRVAITALVVACSLSAGFPVDIGTAEESPPVFERVWGSSGPGAEQFAAPCGVALTPTGELVVTDMGNNRVNVYTATGSLIRSWGTTGTASGQFDHPQAVVVDGGGYVYVLDTYNNRVQKFTAYGGFVTKWGTGGAAAGQFNRARGLAIDGAGNIYVADTNNGRVQKFTSAGMHLASWGTSGTADGQFSAPCGVAVDASGNIFVSDTRNHRIQRLDSLGRWVASWGLQGSGAGEFQEPRQLCVDGSGAVYVADFGNHRVQKLSSSGTSLYSLGVLGYGPGQFQAPYGIAVDASKNLYVSDAVANQVQKFNSVVATALELSAPNLYPSAGAPVELTGRVPAEGAGVPSVPVRIQSSIDGVVWVDVAVTSSNAAGGFSATVAPTSTTRYRAAFAGATLLGSSTSEVLTITPSLLPVSIAFTVSSSSPRAGDAVVLSGRLATADGMGVSGLRVSLQSSLDGTMWIEVGSAVADAYGNYTLGITPSGPMRFRAVSAATNMYAAATSPPFLVTPVLRSASLTITGPSAAPLANTAFTLSGRLAEITGQAVSGVAVKLQRSTNGTAWMDAGTVSTNASGDFSFSAALSSPTHFRAVLIATTIYAAAVSDSVLVAPSEDDDDIAGAQVPPAWPHASAIRDAYDSRDVYRVDTDGSGYPVDLVLLGPSGAIFELEVFPGTASSLDAISPVLRTSGSSWPKGLRLPNTSPTSYLVVVRRVSGSGSYTVTRADHIASDAAFITTSPCSTRYGSALTLKASIIERPWLTSNPVQFKIVSGGKTRYLTTTSRDGVVTHTLKPAARTLVSVRNAAVGTSPAGSWSTPLEVRVTHSLSAPAPSKTFVKRGERFSLRGTVSPSHPIGTRIILEAVHSSGRVIKSTVRVKSRTATSCTWVASGTLGIAGTWRFRARLAADSLHDVGVSGLSRGVVAR